MCGIIGILGTQSAAPVILDGLRRLEYRGYDSAGIATLVGDSIERRRAAGKLTNLSQVLDDSPLEGVVGIGHTRWATHGVPSENNAHPHISSRVAIVHNGIIENFQELRDSLGDYEDSFTSETDTEVVAHLLDKCLDDGMSPQQAVGATLPRLEGAFSLVMIFRDFDNLMIAARRGSPLALGYGDGEMYFGSDALALAPLTRNICYLEEGDWAVATRGGAEIFNTDGEPVERDIIETSITGAMIGKENHRHFMHKEIHEQPTVIGDTLTSVLNPATQTITLPKLPVELASVSRISIGACGTASYAAMVAKYWIEALAGIPVEVDIASELRYRDPPVMDNQLMLVVSQSGETMDTLEALRMMRRKGVSVLSIVNVPESTIARESDAVLLTQAGPEIGVASTKAFTTQLTLLVCLAIALGKAKGRLDRESEARYASALAEVPGRIVEVLGAEEKLSELAAEFQDWKDAFYMGRGTSFPIALEGALKLKEISYIHAEGYAAGEMKHGPLALIEEGVPIVMLAPSDAWFDKTASNVQEMISRGASVIFLSDKRGIEKLSRQVRPHAVVEMPSVDPLVTPILYSIPVQLLAYHAAICKGTDVDQPRNLAKSVTVE
ncbi:MAG: glutamine--fructose-6-phosphate transaminase (isomerizing) [Pseudomonadota bacterium]